MNRRGRRLLWGGLALVLLLGLTVVFGSARFPFLSGALNTVLSPLQQGVSYVTELGSRVSGSLTRFDEVQAENEALKQQVSALNARLWAAEQSQQENRRLRTLLGVQILHPDFTLEPGTVLSRGSSNWSSVVTVNRGASSGVRERQCVITETGALVGLVSQVWETTCTVTTVLDPAFTLSGQVLSTGETAVLNGDFASMTQNRLMLSYLPKHSALQKGDLILTAGLSGQYPAGLLVGTVDAMERDTSGLLETAAVAPAADLDGISHVFFITSFDAPK